MKAFSREKRDVFRLSSDAILWQDQILLGVNKPAGLPCQPHASISGGSLYEAVEIYLAEHGRPHHKRRSIGMHQRIDRYVSGTVLFSIHPSAHRALAEMFRMRQIRKRYLAVVEGTPPEQQGTVDIPLARATRRGRTFPDATGLAALTHWNTLQKTETFSLLDLVPVTGRTHQLRAHLSYLGCPIAGDRTYGAANALPGHRILLHALQLSTPYPLPVEGAPLELCLNAPLPADFLESALSMAPEFANTLRDAA